MKILLNPYNQEMKWCSEFFPDRSFCTLPVAGKPFAEYLIDLSSDLKMDEILLLDYNFDSDYKKILSNGERWSLKLNYIGSGVRKNIFRLVEEHSSFIGEEPTLIVFGAILPEIDCLEIPPELREKAELREDTREGVYLYRDGILMECHVPIHRIRSLKDYFELNFQMLENPHKFVLPGYSAENGVHTGMNVAIMPECEITPPVILGDNICLERGCHLEGGAIIGRDVIIDSGTVIRHSVVFDHTFIGKDMEIADKIIVSGRIIDPYAEVCMMFDEFGITMDMRKYRGRIDWYLVFEYLITLFLVLLFLVPYLLYLPWKKWADKSLWSCKCSADRYPKCLQVFCGHGRLVKYNPEDTEFVFRFSDLFSIRHEKEQQKLDDHYYRYHRTPYLVLKIVVKSLINRLFVTNVQS